MLKEIMDLYHGFSDGDNKPWGKGKVREFLKESLGLENRKESRGYVYDFRDLPKIAEKIQSYMLPTGPATPPDNDHAVVQLREK